MNIEVFAANLADICTHSPVAEGRPLRWTIIANPKAGGFTMRGRWKKNRAILTALAEEAQKRPIRSAGAEPSQTARETDGGNGRLGSLGLVPTRHPAHAGEIVRSLIDEAGAQMNAAESSGSSQVPFHLIITAGGDGTSLEALTALYTVPPQLRASFAILRLPMGTGNDGADARDLGEALSLIAKPSRIVYTKAVQLSTASKGKGPYLAFNILSIGLDAFVTHMTNRMKGKMPGDSYKLWVDIAALFYDRIYPVGTMSFTAEDKQGKRTEAYAGELLLIAFGATGKRTYGSNKKILPDERNVCAIKQMPLLRKLVLKELFITGNHAQKPETLLFDAQSLRVHYDRHLLAQMDGEAVLLEKEDFPVRLELTEARIPTLKQL
ncbi:hypothetical protein MASR2M78_24080 [Treponema sp.]